MEKTEKSTLVYRGGQFSRCTKTKGRRAMIRECKYSDLKKKRCIFFVDLLSLLSFFFVVVMMRRPPEQGSRSV